MTLFTKNLRLDYLDRSDIDSLFEIQSNKNAMQFTICVQKKREAEQRFVSYAYQLEEYGFAPWTVREKPCDRIIGWGGLNVDPDDPSWGLEVAYFLHPEYWGKGYATEVVTESINFARENLDNKTISAFVHTSNIGSMKVLIKCGFVFNSYIEHMNRNYYTLSLAQLA